MFRSRYRKVAWFLLLGALVTGFSGGLSGFERAKWLALLLGIGVVALLEYDRRLSNGGHKS
ncbi:hypothetical protein A7C91_02380 [Thermococcus piezophilus]|uniref:Uncharacterized protein n=2 Tax=Thermococcus piezophilus TaxID=1712654 RepID=A0A172WFH8_9EURY|nr:hypothetical protein A7C91_02380 [Thermococcus piezophilus]